MLENLPLSKDPTAYSLECTKVVEQNYNATNTPVMNELLAPNCSLSDINYIGTWVSNFRTFSRDNISTPLQEKQLKPPNP